MVPPMRPRAGTTLTLSTVAKTAFSSAIGRAAIVRNSACAGTAASAIPSRVVHAGHPDSEKLRVSIALTCLNMVGSLAAENEAALTLVKAPRLRRRYFAFVLAFEGAQN